MAEKWGGIAKWVSIGLMAGAIIVSVTLFVSNKADSVDLTSVKADMTLKADKAEVEAVRATATANCTSIARIDAEVKSNRLSNARVESKLDDILKILLEEKGKK